MIRPNELMIGNYVYVDPITETPVKLKRVTDQLSPLWGIPITEKWLLDFGFEYDKITYRNKTIICAWVKGEFNVWYKYFGEQHKILCDIEHVHTLQNLYFAFTGEELTINKNTNNKL